MTNERLSSSQAAPLHGLVLAGGQSVRMGRDKGGLPYRGEAQVRRAWRMLEEACGRAYVSVRAAQAALPAYSDLPLILDHDGESLGPVAGLMAAWAARPEAAWLVLATDLPFVDAELVTKLMRSRAPGRLATAFRHGDGVPEPLCAIWEPRARLELIERVSSGDRSLRRFLTTPAAALIDLENPRQLASVDSAAEYDVAQRQLKTPDPP
jgi:molybdopterin-guanine dinucleotide biosynthesis protein A